MFADHPPDSSSNRAAMPPAKTNFLGRHDPVTPSYLRFNAKSTGRLPGDDKFHLKVTYPPQNLSNSKANRRLI
jgi:hypothetical protein